MCASLTYLLATVTQFLAINCAYISVQNGYRSNSFRLSGVQSVMAMLIFYL